MKLCHVFAVQGIVSTPEVNVWILEKKSKKFNINWRFDLNYCFYDKKLIKHYCLRKSLKIVKNKHVVFLTFSPQSIRWQHGRGCSARSP
jgi:hypothetical protein